MVTGWICLHGWWSCCLKTIPVMQAGDTPQGTLATRPHARPSLGTPTPGWGGLYLGCWWPCRPLSGRHPGRRLQPAPLSWGGESEGGSSVGAGHPKMFPWGGGGGSLSQPHQPGHHSPELGVQLGGLRVEVLPDGVGALQGGKGTVTAGTPHPLSPPPQAGQTPSSLLQRDGAAWWQCLAGCGFSDGY